MNSQPCIIKVPFWGSKTGSRLPALWKNQFGLNSNRNCGWGEYEFFPRQGFPTFLHMLRRAEFLHNTTLSAHARNEFAHIRMIAIFYSHECCLSRFVVLENSKLLRPCPAVIRSCYRGCVGWESLSLRITRSR